MRLISFPRHNWHQLRAVTTADDTALTTFDYASWPSSNTFNLEQKFQKYVSSLLIAFYGTDAENEAGAYVLRGRGINGPIMELAAGAFTLGAQLVTRDPISGSLLTAYWADTITVTSGIMDAVDVLHDAAGDKICLLQVPVWNLEEIYLELAKTTNASAGAVVTGIYNG